MFTITDTSYTAYRFKMIIYHPLFNTCKKNAKQPISFFFLITPVGGLILMTFKAAHQGKTHVGQYAS